MSLSKEMHKAALMARGLPEWQAEMVAATAADGGIGFLAEDARAHAGIHERRGCVIPERQMTDAERANLSARDDARRAANARRDRLEKESRERELEWRNRLGR